MDRGADFRQAEAMVHRQSQLGNQVASIFCDDRRSDNFVAPFFDVDPDEAFVDPIQNRAIVVFQRLSERVDFKAGLFA